MSNYNESNTISIERCAHRYVVQLETVLRRQEQVLMQIIERYRKEQNLIDKTDDEIMNMLWSDTTNHGVAYRSLLRRISYTVTAHDLTKTVTALREQILDLSIHPDVLVQQFCTAQGIAPSADNHAYPAFLTPDEILSLINNVFTNTGLTRDELDKLIKQHRQRYIEAQHD